MVCAALAATVVSCRHEMPLQYMAGVVEAVTPSSLTVRSIAGDSVLMFVVDEATERSGGDAIEGNAVEVCYRGSHDSPELTALSVTGNETYTDVLGRWATGRRAELPVEIELLPRGVWLNGLLAVKQLYRAKLLVCNTQYAYVPELRKKRLYPLYMHLGVLHAGAVAHVD